MAGGHWEKQNKVRPGAYVNFETNDLVTTGLDSKGAVVIPFTADWGVTEDFVKVTPNTNFLETFGKDLGDLLPLREALKGNGNILAYNLNSEGDKATAKDEDSDFTATAIYPGDDGNKITVNVILGLDSDYTVKTFYDGDQVDKQTAIAIEDLEDNAFVTFTGDDLPSGDVILTLSGGNTVDASNSAYSDLAGKLDSQIFKAIALSTDDSATKAIFSAKVAQWIEEEGKNVVLVTNDYNAADHEGVISVLNGVTVEDGEKLTAEQTVYWFAAAYASAGIKSMTYMEYPGAIDCERLDNDEIVRALQEGHIVFTYNEGMDGIDKVVVEQDINTYRSFTKEKNQDFRKNKIVREMFNVSDNVQHVFSRFFIGKITNNDNGRDLFKGEVMKVVLDPLVKAEAIDPYDVEDLVFEQGREKDAVLVNMGIKFNDAMEKLYMTVHCQ